ncbi:hypothetical protein H6P81_000803 [Aristolochia fimbriata]|uniref:WRKY domain-containing protein n=1 Tax=Aristolochia fimbriata TaxID=158543 RepID=A0AAV7F7R6_ARIFI|nr:hypothetical protein H6P81_000803 [Aristolochia fimbriata]
MESSLQLDASSLSLDLNITAHLPSKLSQKEEAVALAAELNRVSEENQKLTQMLSVVCENFWALQSQMRGLTGKSMDKEPTSSRKRKEESLGLDIHHDYTSKVPAVINGNAGVNYSSSDQVESTSSEESACKKQCKIPNTKISKLYVRTDPSDTTLVVKDGYQWRKYGQKVTRDNPCPRAYFKCSFAPSCPVKKKVQRSAEDRSLLVATYDGEHNHPHPSQPNLTSNSTASTTSSSHGVGRSSPVPCSLSLASSSPTVTLDLTRPQFVEEATKSTSTTTRQDQIMTNSATVSGSGSGSHKFLVEQMASSLVKDPNFTTALAAAISGRILQPSLAGKW